MYIEEKKTINNELIEIISLLVTKLVNFNINGAILIFVPSWNIINKLMNYMMFNIKDPTNKTLQYYPLHSLIAQSEQNKIFEPVANHIIKIIISTNIAETSITIPDVSYVIDSGLMKEKWYDAYSKMSSLSPILISKANAKQRCGRAGRVKKGYCFRLYSNYTYQQMNEYQIPEILRTSLESLCLQCKILKIPNLHHFFLSIPSKPDVIAIHSAINSLKDLDALDADENLTTIGYKLAQLPLEPKLSKILLYGSIFKCLDAIASIIACLSYNIPFIIVNTKEDIDQLEQIKLMFSAGIKCEFILLLNIIKAYESSKNKKLFTRQYYLNNKTLSMIIKIKNQFIKLLADINYIKKGIKNQQKLYNKHNDNYALIRAIIHGCLYPNIARPINNHKRIKNTIFYTYQSDKYPIKCNILSKGIFNIKKKLIDKNIFISYYDIIRSDKIFLKYISIINPLTILLLASKPFSTSYTLATKKQHDFHLQQLYKTSTNQMNQILINDKLATELYFIHIENNFNQQNIENYMKNQQNIQADDIETQLELFSQYQLTDHDINLNDLLIDNNNDHQGSLLLEENSSYKPVDTNDINNLLQSLTLDDDQKVEQQQKKKEKEQQQDDEDADHDQAVNEAEQDDDADHDQTVIEAEQNDNADHDQVENEAEQDDDADHDQVENEAEQDDDADHDQVENEAKQDDDTVNDQVENEIKQDDDTVNETKQEEQQDTNIFELNSFIKFSLTNNDKITIETIRMELDWLLSKQMGQKDDKNIDSNFENKLIDTIASMLYTQEAGTIIPKRFKLDYNLAKKQTKREKRR